MRLETSEGNVVSETARDEPAGVVTMPGGTEIPIAGSKLEVLELAELGPSGVL